MKTDLTNADELYGDRDEYILEIPMGPMGFPWEWESPS